MNVKAIAIDNQGVIVGLTEDNKIMYWSDRIGIWIGQR